MSELHTLWPIGAQSFRVLMHGARWQRPLRLPSVEEATLDGDQDLPPATSHVVTHATAVAAPRAMVWAWLSQMLRGGGPYGWRELETIDCCSADYLLEATAPPAVGDRVDNLFQLALVSPERELVWRATLGLSILDVSFTALTLHYQVRETSPQTTLLTVRARGLIEHVTTSIANHRFAMLDAILPTQQTARIKVLAEARGASSTTRGVRHQHAAFVPAALAKVGRAPS